MSKSHKDLLVWQKSIELAIKIHKLTENFPRSELFGITSQMRRAAISIPANIAEGSARGYRKEYLHFVSIAFGSVTELETHALIAEKLNFIKGEQLQDVQKLIEEIAKMVNALSKALSKEK